MMPWCRPRGSRPRSRASSSRLLRCVLMLLGVGVMHVPTRATTIQWFTDPSAFQSQLDVGYYNSFAPPPGDLGVSGTTFTGGGWSFSGTATGGLYGLSGIPYPGETGLQPLDFSMPLTFNAFSPYVTAFGGTFSLRDGSEIFSSGTVGLSIYTGSNVLTSSTNLTVSGSAGAFRGVILYSATAPITRVELTAVTSPATLLPTAQGVIVGVPEPSTLASLAVGLASVGLAVRLRRRALKAACVAVAVLAMSARVAFALADEPAAAGETLRAAIIMESPQSAGP
jgi:hypothetical protein